MNNAGQTPKNIRIAQVNREAAQVGSQVGSVCSSSKETRHTEHSGDTDFTTKIRNAYPISTFRGATQDELVECVRSIVVGVLNELDSLAEDHTVAGDGDRSVHVRYLQIMRERWMI